MIFIDSNIPMYLIGKAHPNKERALTVLRQITEQNSRLVSSTEVMQEICHRYTAIKKKEAILPCYEALLAMVDEVYPIELATVTETHRLLLAHSNLSARDAIHLAVMKTKGIDTLLSFDTDFDSVSTIRRIPAL